MVKVSQQIFSSSNQSSQMSKYTSTNVLKLKQSTSSKSSTSSIVNYKVQYQLKC